MTIPDCPFTVTDWRSGSFSEHPGDSGKALWRTLEIGDVRIRMIEYTPDYVADHWCERGHILLVLEGELDTELRDGRTYKLTAGMGYEVSDAANAAHRSSTKTGARLFVVD